MRTSRRFVMVLLVLAAASSPSLAGDGPVRASSATVHLTLSRAPTPEKLYPLLPVFLQLQITNDSDDAIRIWPLTTAGNPFFKLFWAAGTTSPLERRYPPRRLLEGSEAYDATRREGPDISVVFSTDIEAHSEFRTGQVYGYFPLQNDERPKDQNALEWSLKRAERMLHSTFWRPGEYRIKVSVEGYKRAGEGPRSFEVESNELRILISEPQGEDAAAYGLLLKSNAPQLFSDPWFYGFTKAKESVPGAIYDQFPNSVYYPYAKLFVAFAHCQFMARGNPGWCESDPIAGLKMLKEVAEDPSVPLLADFALLSLPPLAAVLPRNVITAYLRAGAPKTMEDNANRLRPDAEIWSDPTVVQAPEYLSYAEARLRKMLPDEATIKPGDWVTLVREVQNKLIREKYWARVGLRPY